MPLNSNAGAGMASWFEVYVVPVVTGLGGAGAVWAYLQAKAIAKSKEPADLLNAMAVFSEQVHKHSEALVSDLRTEIERLKLDAAEYRDRMEHEGDALRDRIADLENDNVTCRRENADLVQRQHVLVTWLRGQGLTVPEDALPRIITEFDKGAVSVHDVGQPLEA